MEHNETHTNSHKGLMMIGAVALLLAGLLGGYFIGKGSETSSSPSATSASINTVANRASATEHNAADTMFMQMMLPHHAQATDMAKLAETRAESPEVKALAAKIQAAQQPEIDKMTDILTAWSESPDSLMDMEDHSSHSMDGMMSKEDMTALEAMSGAEFDETFLSMMTEHHTGAISMAKEELSKGTNADALALATAIQVTQQAEVAQMKALLK